MARLEKARLEQIFSGFSGVRILVVGDLMLDRFVWGNVTRISPEAPVPVVEVTSESEMPGGAANVAHNIYKLGGGLCIAGIVGDDNNGRILREKLANERADVGGIIVGEKRKTTIKMRIVAHRQQVVRVDYEDIGDLSGSQIDKIAAYVKGHLDEIDAFLIEDYGKGLVIQPLVDRLVELGKAAGKIMTFDPKEGNDLDVRGVTAVTPNKSEAIWAAGREMPERDLGAVLLDKWGCESVLLTLGEHGMLLFQYGKELVDIPCAAREVYDVSGAGDTVISAFTMALAAGASMDEAAVISNYAAGIVVGKVGTAAVTQEELWKEMVNA